MTLHPEPDGSVSFRVLIAVNGGHAKDSDMLELIVGASYTGRLSIVLAGHGAAVAEGPTRHCLFRVRSGFVRTR